MALPPSVEALKNERTGKLFIVLDWDVGDNKIKVINPTGSVLEVTKLILKMDETYKVAAANYADSFSAEQVSKLESWEKELFVSEEKKRLEKAAKSSQRAKSTTKAVPKKRAASARTEGVIDKKASSSGRRPAVEWATTELTFYRHHIEKLKPNDVFAVVVESVGTFHISKAEFQRVFNNVVMDAEYRTQGVFRYQDIPEEAKAFLKL